MNCKMRRSVLRDASNSLAEFTHAEHLKVAFYYLHLHTFEHALNMMREGLIRFTRHHGKAGYHETITRFWLHLLELHRGEPFADVLAHCADKELLWRHYSRESIASDRARRQWLEPDLLLPELVVVPSLKGTRS